MTERRRRYANALYEARMAFGAGAYSRFADAAMAVADAEIADFRVEIKDAYMVATVLHRELELSRQEAARLRAELAHREEERRRAYAALGWHYDGRDDV